MNSQASELKVKLLPEYKAAYGVTEKLKADDQMEWVQLMNTIAHQIDEIILSDIINMKD